MQAAHAFHARPSALIWLTPPALSKLVAPPGSSVRLPVAQAVCIASLIKAGCHTYFCRRESQLLARISPAAPMLIQPTPPASPRAQSKLFAPLGSSVRLPVAQMVCNQSPPLGEQPSLMTFREVETLFHE